MKKTKEELKEEVMESATEEPVNKPIDYDKEIEQCRGKLLTLEEIVAEHIRKNMGLGSTEKKRVSYVDTDRGSFISVADIMTELFGPKE